MIPGDEIARVARAVASAYLARGIPFERAELEQEGFRIGLEAFIRHQRRRSRSELAAYLRTAIALDLGRAIAVWSSVTTAPKHRRWTVSADRPSQVRIPVSEREGSLDDTPEALVSEKQWLDGARAELERVTKRLNEIDQLVVSMLRTSDEKPQAIAKQVGVPVKAVYRVRDRLMEQVRRESDRAAL